MKEFKSKIILLLNNIQMYTDLMKSEKEKADIKIAEFDNWCK